MKVKKMHLYTLNWHYRGDKPYDGWICEVNGTSKKDAIASLAKSHNVSVHDIIVSDSWILD